jgi:hypothetical protein
LPEERLDDSVVGYAMDGGFTRREAECLADGFENAFGTADPSDEDLDGEEDLRAMVRVTMHCEDAAPAEGVSDEMEDCLVDAAIEGLGLDAPEISGARPFLDAYNDFGYDERVAITEASLRCAGLSASTAACVVDELQENLPEYFDSPPERYQREAEAIVQECLGGS